MNRRHVHSAFALGAVLLASLAVHQAMQLRHAQRVNTAITSANSPVRDSTIPEARFKHAAAMAEAGNYDTAAAAYKELARDGRTDLKRAAALNLGNLHLRQALKQGAESATQWLPMIELAKQSYRTLLREHPGDWDARYNLEIALRLAPEADETAITIEGPPPDSERTTSTISNSRMDLP